MLSHALLITLLVFLVLTVLQLVRRVRRLAQQIDGDSTRGPTRLRLAMVETRRAARDEDALTTHERPSTFIGTGALLYLAVLTLRQKHRFRAIA